MHKLRLSIATPDDYRRLRLLNVNNASAGQLVSKNDNRQYPQSLRAQKLANIAGGYFANLERNRY